ncbi:MAG: alpha-2-macroglobulin family protein [Ilumatobacteraceae bacterium]
MPTTVGGQYRVRARIADDHGGTSRTELTRWVSGAAVIPTRGVEQQTLVLVPNAREYSPGATAEVLVQSPIDGEALAVVSRNGIERTERFTVADGTATLRIPIVETDVPNIGVTIEVVGTAPRTLDDGTPLAGAPARPAYAVGNLNLSVSTASRTLDVTVTPADPSAAPGTSTSLGVAVVGPDGAPVTGAEFAVAVVDEAVLALSGTSLIDPITTFYGELSTYLDARFARQHVVLARPEDTVASDGTDSAATTTVLAADTTAAASMDAAEESAAGAAPSVASRNGVGADAMSSKAATGEPIDVRTDFDPVALFRPSITTDETGHAAIPFDLPDNLTRYRVMVVAVSGDDRFGSGEAAITARLPLMIRPSAPRFANYGDRFEFPVLVQNQTNAAMEVEVLFQDETTSVGRRLTVPANDRIETRFPVETTHAGTAAFRVAAVSGAAADAASIELPVYTPATAEAFATYGTIDDGAILQPMDAIAGVRPSSVGSRSRLPRPRSRP